MLQLPRAVLEHFQDGLLMAATPHSNAPIQEGDLVQIVRWPCCGSFIGEIYTVYGFGSRGRKERMCIKCDVFMPAGTFADIGSNPSIANRHGMVPLTWLKRIPPLSELEGVKTDEPIEEPA